ncbi:MAG: transposase [Nevskia sp.]|jgi:transposase|nr:transposase [Nevskia sp.]MCK9383056.1 transposase [Nevskia sp.]
MTERLSAAVPGFVVGRKQNGRCIYSREGKRALVEECLRPGVSVARLALTHQVNANLLRKWIKAHEASVTRTPSASAELLPVIPINAPAATRPSSPESPIEIVIGEATVRLRGAVDAQQLRTILDCLARRA